VAIWMGTASSRRGPGAGSRRAQVDEMEEEDISWLLMSFILVFPDSRHQFLIGQSEHQKDFAESNVHMSSQERQT
jgi:hypothetical protein